MITQILSDMPVLWGTLNLDGFREVREAFDAKKLAMKRAL